MHTNWRFIYVFLAVFVVLTAVPVSADEAGWALTETQEVELQTLTTGSFNIDYPSGWFTDAKQSVVVFNELAADHQIAFDGPFATEGYSISFVLLGRRDLPSGDLTLENLLAANSERYGYQNPAEVAETTLISWSALRVQTVDGMGNHISTIMGFYAKINAFVFTLAAPSAEALDAFLPTWDAMLESITINTGLVNLGDYSLYIECSGEGSPAVILEQGAGNSHSYWATTLRGVSEFTRVCSHERDVLSIKAPRSSQDFAEDLHNLLTKAGVEGPYVLVGHSIGGLNVRVYADRYPDEVVGMVLVDSSHENQGPRSDEFLLQFVSQEALDAAAQSSDTALKGLRIDWAATVAQVAATGSLGDMPLVVLTAGMPMTFPPFTRETAHQWQQIWIDELQADLASLSTNSTQFVLEKRNHPSMVNDPAVVEAIQQVVEEVRAGE